jgi:hypothetical protein
MSTRGPEVVKDRQRIVTLTAFGRAAAEGFTAMPASGGEAGACRRRMTAFTIASMVIVATRCRAAPSWC